MNDEPVIFISPAKAEAVLRQGDIPTAPPYLRTEFDYGATVTRVHMCKRCGTYSSVFWHPFSYGCGRDDEDEATGGQYFELCDGCFLSYAGWLAEGRRKEGGE